MLTFLADYAPGAKGSDRELIRRMLDRIEQVWSAKSDVPKLLAQARAALQRRS